MKGQQSARSPAHRRTIWYGMYASEALNRARSTGSWPELPPKLLITACFIVGSKGGNLTAREINELNCGSVVRCTWSCPPRHVLSIIRYETKKRCLVDSVINFIKRAVIIIKSVIIAVVTTKSKQL